MTREILFRGKSDIGNAWCFGYYMKCKDEYGNVVHWIIKEDRLKCEVTFETVGQYTGLTDKSGRRIFEGDILSAHLDDNFPKDETIVVVVWEHNAWCIQESSEPAIIEDNELEDDGWEIIGNIHDNPALLEEKNEKM